MQYGTPNNNICAPPAQTVPDTVWVRVDTDKLQGSGRSILYTRPSSLLGVQGSELKIYLSTYFLEL